MIPRTLSQSTAVFAAVFIAIVLLKPASANAQATGGQIDINQILQTLGGIGGIGVTPTTDGADGVDMPTQPIAPPVDGGTGSETRQPITNTLDSVNREGLNNRRPGIWIENAQAVATGDTEFFTGEDTEEPPSFFRDTFNEIFMILFDTFSGILTGANTLITAGSGIPGIGGGGTDGTGIGAIPNPATTGAGTTTMLQ